VATKRQRKKKRQRGASRAPRQVATEPQETPQQTTPARRRPGDGPPPPPWGSFPLSELVILVALVLLVAGFFVPPPRGGVMIGVGLGLGSLAGLELAVREHFSGYRSHTLLLGGAAGVAVVAILFALGPDSLPLAAAVGIGAVVFAAAGYGFALAFRRRSGGELFRFRA
jgi:hypothetical protein